MTISSNSLVAYPDCEAAFHTALNRGTIHLTFPSVSAAASFVARANKYRVLLRERSAENGGPHESIYDSIIIRRPARGAVVIFEPRSIDFTITTPDGKPVEPVNPPQLADPIPLPEGGESSETYDDFLAQFLPPEPPK